MAGAFGSVIGSPGSLVPVWEIVFRAERRRKFNVSPG